MRKTVLLLSFVFCLAPLAALPAGSTNSVSWQFEVAIRDTPATQT